MDASRELAARAARKARKHLGKTRSANRSWSQSGEDRIAAFVLGQLNIDRPLYLDLGAHDAKWLSNTYLFYRNGARGILVEANPLLCKALRRQRPRDVCLNLAVAPQDGTVSLHVMDAATLSTTSDEEAAAYGRQGHDVTASIEVPAVSPSSLLASHLDRTPDLVSLDVEGVDLAVIEAWPFDDHRPPVWIVETLEYTRDRSERKVTEVIDAMTTRGYDVYGDTHINTIFVDRTAYES